MKRIAIDMDEVIADFTKKHLQVYNEAYKEDLKMEDLNGTRLWKIRASLSREILDFVDDPTFFRDLEVMEGSQEVIRELTKQYEVYITTAAMEHPNSFTAKHEWLKEHFPFLNDMNFVFCGDKSIIHADYLIDDNPKHFANFKGEGILFTASHNIHEQKYTRVDSWKEVYQLLIGE
ncbi:5' nucleotidase, NT5C type [Pseudalkalibacillus sp. Hm43]|uniref:5' nucleotidase, NT5C type n=1 Tax=Pseudalkalibacillus sp. Hm43 TaxID=3450742 RepID=UPI003F4221B8